MVRNNVSQSTMALAALFYTAGKTVQILWERGVLTDDIKGVTTAPESMMHTVANAVIAEVKVENTHV